MEKEIKTDRSQGTRNDKIHGMGLRKYTFGIKYTGRLGRTKVGIAVEFRDMAQVREFMKLNNATYVTDIVAHSAHSAIDRFQAEYKIGAELVKDYIPGT